ncbi:hypothetical protein ACPXB3_21875 [Gordonia sp. DT219]|uniref:hypothetical protein n=1 Tax=Gordonia sp. DT219 TaxID=3416658 RepID=UPI003CE74807
MARKTETQAEYEQNTWETNRRKVLVFIEEPTCENPWGQLAWVHESEVGDRRRWGEVR